MLTRIRAIATKEFLHVIRDVRSLVAAMGLPLVMLVLYGYAINLDVKHVPTALYDQDRTQASRDLAGAFSRSGYFDINYAVSRESRIGEALDRGLASVVLVIPRGFAAHIARGKNTPVQVIVDGSDSTTATTAIGYANAIIQQESLKVTIEAIRRLGFADVQRFIPVDARLRIWYNPELESANFMVPGLIATVLMILAALITSLTVVRERERGTIEQLVVSPILPHELMLGKMIPYIIIAFVDVVLVTVAGRLIFDVPLRGSVILLLALSAVFVAAALGLGLFISAAAKTQQGATTVALIGTLLPTILLSGFVFPISSMPRIIQALTYLIPARHFLVIVRAIFLKGVGLSAVWPQALILAAFAAAMLALSSLGFKKRL